MWPLVTPVGLARAFLPLPEVQIQQEGVGSVFSQNSAWSEGLLRSRSPLGLVRACQVPSVVVDTSSGAPTCPSKSHPVSTTRCWKAIQSLHHQVLGVSAAMYRGTIHDTSLASEALCRQLRERRVWGRAAPAVWQPRALLQLPTTLRFCHRLLKTWHGYRNKWALKGNPDFYVCHLFPDYLPGGQALRFDT